MENSDVNKILNIFLKKDCSEFYENYDLDWKKNKWLKISKFPEFNFVRKLINEDLKRINEFYQVGDFITLLIYNKGDFFGSHIDGPSYISTKSKTVMTGGYLLNTGYKGGDFIVEDTTLNTKPGELFLFGRNVWHEVKEVTEGTRYSLHFAINENRPKILI